MAARVYVFLRDPPQRLETTRIRHGIEAADWLTLGEIFKLEEDEVRAFMAGVRWHDDPLGFDREGERAVRIDLHTETDYVQILIEELDQFTKPVIIPDRVRRHLRDVKGVVSIAMGAMQLRTMYETIAFEIAYWLAATFDGLILSDDDQWYDHDANRWKPIAGPS